MKSLPIHDGAFTVLLECECNPGESEGLARHLSEFIRERTRRHVGYLSALVYLSEDGHTIVAHFQWARAGDWSAWRASKDGHRFAELLAGCSQELQFLELVDGIPALHPGEHDPAGRRES
jgi:hypothetical protein